MDSSYMTSGAQTQQSPNNLEPFLVKTILKKLQLFELPHNLARPNVIESNVELPLLVLEKKGLYLTDGDVCVQANLGRPLHEISLNPRNTLSNQFYAPHAKPHLVFNCHDQTVTDQPPVHASPYHPCFHFRDYAKFKSGRKMVEINEECERMYAKKWDLAIVNINSTGYYAPFLIIKEYRKDSAVKSDSDQNSSSGNWNRSIKRPTVRLTQPVENILFNQTISQLLERWRVRDMQRSWNCDIPKPPHDFSMAYYMRNSKMHGKTATANSCFVSLDTRFSVLKVDKSAQVRYIPINIVNQANSARYSYDTRSRQETSDKKIYLFSRPVEHKFVADSSLNTQLNLSTVDSLRVNRAHNYVSDDESSGFSSESERRYIEEEKRYREQLNDGAEEEYGGFEDHEYEPRNYEAVKMRLSDRIQEELNNIIDLEESDESEEDILRTLYKRETSGSQKFI